MLKFLKYGFLSGLYTAILNVVILLVVVTLYGDTIVWAGQNKDTLYPAVVFMVSLISCIVGSVLSYAIFFKQNKGLRNYGILVILLAILNSIAGELSLAEPYRMLSHITHLIVAAGSIWFMKLAGLRNIKH